MLTFYHVLWFQEKLRRRVASNEVKVLNAPRPGKKLLVLDIDYTLYDLGSAAGKPFDKAAGRVTKLSSKNGGKMFLKSGCLFI